MSLFLEQMVDLAEAATRSPMEVVQDALSRTNGDAGALFMPEVLKAIRDVRGDSHADWQRVSADAKRRKVNITELAKLTTPPPVQEAADPDNEGGLFPPIVHWPEPVDGAELIADIVQVIRQHVIAEEPTFLATALWVMHTYGMGADPIWTISPIANITAAEKRCGKTVLLNVIKKLSYRSIATSSISASALYRSIEMLQPTLLIDEADATLRDNEDLRGIINSGLYNDPDSPDGVIRCDGDDHMPKMFRVFCAKVLCGIGSRADTIEDRSIPLRLRRKLPHEHTANVRHSDLLLWRNLRSRAKRWVEDNRADLRKLSMRPVKVAGLHERACDCWEPLLAIADHAGMGMEARAAAQSLHDDGGEEQLSINTELLRDVRDMFDRNSASFLSTKRLRDLLTSDEELSWAEYGFKAGGITVKAITTKLSGYGVKPSKPSTGKRERGFYRKDFEEAFVRFLPSDSDDRSGHPGGIAGNPHGAYVCEGAGSLSTSGQSGSYPDGWRGYVGQTRPDRSGPSGSPSGSKTLETIGAAQSVRMSASIGESEGCPF